MLLIFGATLFLSATLLFLVQPMVAKMVLPLLGGTPAVWNTCMVFFQALLLAGYAYAHAAPARLGLRRQVWLHGALLLVPFLVLPIAIAHGFLPPTGSNPIPWLLGLLAVSVGLPFFVVSTTAPLLQRWIAGTGHRAARDPYFLYAASNVGSMLALLGYPTLVEPHLRLQDQSLVWTGAYGLLVALIAACAAWTWRAGRARSAAAASGAAAAASAASPVVEAGGEPTALERLRWTALAFVPSSLMLGVTTYLTTDIAAIPLFWVVPLALYLATFIIAFSGAFSGLRSELRMWLPVLTLWLLFTILLRASLQPTLEIPLHLAVFFLAALACHSELARRRPSARHLTEFYLWMSFGGVLGGIFNVLVAPFLFSSVAEYPLLLALAPAFLAGGAAAGGGRAGLARDLLPAAAVGALATALIFLVPVGAFDPRWLGPLLVYGLPLVLCFFFIRRPSRFGLGLCAVVLAATFLGGRQDNLLHRERSFFGVVSVQRDADGRFTQFFHGTTLHGQQFVDPARRDEPTSYYRRGGAVAQVFAAFSGPQVKSEVAVVGLGTGTLAIYGRPGQRMTYYEIDPAVLRIASDTRWFTFLRDSPARIDVVLGDARLRLAEAPNGAYGLMVLDAFTSDAIPVHLVTREAIQLYLTKLQSDGVLVFNVSNRYLELEPVLEAVARGLGLSARIQRDDANLKPGEQASIWVVMARRDADLGALASDPRWRRLQGRPGVAAWTDDFSNLLGVLLWKTSAGVTKSPPPGESGEKRT
jgi:SAM-dependent methyltransferase